jgi:hypothetical protein
MGDPTQQTLGSSFVSGPQSPETSVVIETQQPASNASMMVSAKPVKRGMGLKEEDAVPERGTGLIEETPTEETPRRNGAETSKFVDAHKIAAVLAKHNIKDIDPKLLNIKDIKDDPKSGMTLKLDNGHELHMGRLPDGRQSISWKPGELTRKDAAAIVSLGKAAHFGDVHINGNDRDKTLLCIEAAKQGVKVLNPPPQDVFEKYKKEIEAEEKNPGQSAAKSTGQAADTKAPDQAAGGDAPATSAPKRQAARSGGMKI